MPAAYSRTAERTVAPLVVAAMRVGSYLMAVPVFDEQAMRALVGCTEGTLGVTSEAWLDETRGPVADDES